MVLCVVTRTCERRAMPALRGFRLAFPSSLASCGLLRLPQLLGNTLAIDAESPDTVVLSGEHHRYRPLEPCDRGQLVLFVVD